MVDWCDADHTSPLEAGRISGTQSLRVLLGSLSGLVSLWMESGRRDSTTSILRFVSGLANFEMLENNQDG